VTVTAFTGIAVTVSGVEPDLLSLVAKIVTGPGATPVTNPVDDTVAMPVLDELHEIARPVRTFPLASLVAAVSCTVCVTVSVFEGAESCTVATATPVGGPVESLLPPHESRVSPAIEAARVSEKRAARERAKCMEPRRCVRGSLTRHGRRRRRVILCSRLDRERARNMKEATGERGDAWATMA